MTEQNAKPEAPSLAQEGRQMDAEISRLEAELAAPARGLTWEEVKGGVPEDLAEKERRRLLLPRLIAAAKVKRLELRREGYEREAEPLRKLRDDAHERLLAAQEKRRVAVEEENRARFDYSNPQMRLDTIEERTKAIDREVRALRGEG